ncbi:dipeptidase [Specibacter cremeus]|uniref:dipeptidase n=1 Tax=Specibacter cremeus TaxID=1629051 RepID=UPI000F7B880D|nr:membrane dipeptidase [Specibacter cremeus]
MLLIDGLECSNYNREIFRELHDAKVSAVTITAAFWEDALETMDELGRWNDRARNNADLITIARTAEDIESAAAGGRTAVILGVQNSTPLNDRLRFVELFHRMGLRVMQLTYNNQNAVGGSCYEPEDSGLTRFGREVVHEMNRVGMLVDLSHVGNRTSLEAIHASESPVAITHANPASLVEHPRNKPDDVLKALADAGGVLGLATYNNIAGDYATSPQAWADMVARTVDLIGIDHVGIGTDLGQNSGDGDLDWMRRGRWTRDAQPGAALSNVPEQDWFRSPTHFEAITSALRDHGRFEEKDIDAILGGNWMRLYRGVFKP